MNRLILVQILLIVFLNCPEYVILFNFVNHSIRQLKSIFNIFKYFIMQFNVILTF